MDNARVIGPVARAHGVARRRQKEYRAIKRIETADELLTFQANQLAKLLTHASNNVPYYQRILADRVSDQNRPDRQSLDHIPTLTRELLRKHFEDLKSTDMGARKWREDRTGGSTGEPVKFVKDAVYYRWARATNYYYYNDILGVDEPSCKKLLLWGSPRKVFQGSAVFKAKVTNWLANTVVLPSSRMTPRDMERYIRTINGYKPELIRGHSNSLYELCRFAERKNLALYCPKKVISAADSLTEYMREEIEGVFGTKVYDFYGARETGNLAGECDKGLMHIFDFWNYVEILDDTGQHVSVGQEGNVVVANLFNHAMPLIRYEIGDMAVRGPAKCPCGSILPTLRTITGRRTDRFVLEDGTVIDGLIFLGIFGVHCNKGQFKQFQVIQEDFRRVRIVVALEKRLDDSDRKNIESRIRKVMQDCHITWDVVDEIPKTKSGKYQFVKSLVGG